MKNFLCLCVAGLLLLGCKSAPSSSSDHPKKKTEAQKPKGPVGVQNSNPGEYMFVKGSGDKAWYSSLELEQIVRAYIDKENLEFDFQNSTKAIWVDTEGGKKLASMYFQTKGGLFLQVDVGHKGQVLAHKFGPNKTNKGE